MIDVFFTFVLRSARLFRFCVCSILKAFAATARDDEGVSSMNYSIYPSPCNVLKRRRRRSSRNLFLPVDLAL